MLVETARNMPESPGNYAKIAEYSSEADLSSVDLPRFDLTLTDQALPDSVCSFVKRRDVALILLRAPYRASSGIK